ncbi:MAG: class I SAM-dependent DNA methyltransferase, partial [Planctomycetaceae bacterium]|nr:class I SAM-dependent DNA methyltransferase [Planctomycetaceae bacterium]
RAAEEAQGKIRWLRPEFQNPQGTQPQKTQGKLLDTADEEDAPTTSDAQGKPAKPAKVDKQPWPKSLPEQIKAVRDVLTTLAAPTTAKDLAKNFKSAKAAKVEELLETLVTVGQATVTDDGRYVG